MKRMAAVALAMLLAVMPVAVYGEEAAETTGVALDAMTLRELVTLQGQVEQEIYKRTGLGFEDDAIGDGWYVVGTDIKPGKYELVSAIEDDSLWNGNRFAIIKEDTPDSPEYVYQNYNFALGSRAMIELENGNVLVLRGGSFRIKPFEHSWMP